VQTIAARVAEEMDTPLGERVGYTIRFEDVTTQVQWRGIQYLSPYSVWCSSHLYVQYHNTVQCLVQYNPDTVMWERIFI